MSIHPQAGKLPTPAMLVNLPRLLRTYYTGQPDPAVPSQCVAFGTSGHRGCALNNAFNEAHILAITQAICLYRKEQGITGPLFMGIDTHALSEPAQATALEVLAGNGVEVFLADGDGFTPTPVLSHAILKYNRGRTTGLADGIGITPSHNPPQDGGFKYNPPSGGPADSVATSWIERKANEFLRADLAGVARLPHARALRAATTHRHDYMADYIPDLANVVDMDLLKASQIRIGADPLGGAGVEYWGRIGEYHGLNLTVVNPNVDATFRFMSVDWDGKIRMDPSSPYAMRGLVDLKDKFDIAFGCDADHDRHGIVTRSAGLLPPNHFLAVCIRYLFQNRPQWKPEAAIGKTLVSSSILDRVAARIGRRLVEVPVGFKWFVDGLTRGELAFVGEESAGATFVRRDGTVWTTDKDGFVPALLAAEITARTGKDPGEHYREITAELGDPVYDRVDAPATPAQKKKLSALSPDQVRSTELAGETIRQRLTAAPGNNASIGGLKVCTDNGWFAARPSGTEDIYKIYAESFLGMDHLRRIQADAREIVAQALA